MESVKAPPDRGSELTSRDAPDRGHEGAGSGAARGTPSWAVALALLALVAIVLGAAFFLNARLKPKVGPEPVAAVGATAGATAAAMTVPSPVPSTAAPTMAGATAPAIVGAADASNQAAAVTQAYLHYWGVYDNALLTFDTTHLSDVAAGDELARDSQSVDDLRAAHQALKSDVTHHVEVTSIATGSATVHDQYIDRSYLIDSRTQKSLGTPASATTQTIACQLRLIDGGWKVVNVVQVAVTVVHQ